MQKQKIERLKKKEKEKIKIKIKTSSFVIDWEKSTLNKLKKKKEILSYDLPRYTNKNNRYDNEYTRLHLLAREEIDLPYYINTINKKKIYLLKDQNKEAPEVKMGTEKELEYKKIKPIKKELKYYLNLFIVNYFYEKKFSSSGKFYIYVKGKGKYATALKINIEEDWIKGNNDNLITFFVSSQATRMKMVDREEYQKQSYKRLPFVKAYLKSDFKTYFKQIKKGELKKHEGSIWIKDPNKNSPTQLTYHSIKNKESYERTRVNFLEDFIDEFVGYLKNFGIDLKTKEVEFQQIINPTNSKVKKDENLIKDFRISIVDGRFNKDRSLEEILVFLENSSYRFKKLDDIDISDNLLFVMDYLAEDFDKDGIYSGKEDPYKKLKKDQNLKMMAKQGLCIKKVKNSKEQKNDVLPKELERNLSICQTELHLKRTILSHKEENFQLQIPNKELLYNKIFSSDGYYFYLEGNENLNEKLIIEKNTNLPKIIVDRIGLPMELVIKTFKDISKDDIGNEKFIFSKDSIMKIEDIPERPFYKKIRKRLERRECKRKLGDFKIDFKKIDFEIKKKSNPDLKNQIKEYNDYLDSKVSEDKISYEELIFKYGKNGFLKKIFGFNNARKFIQILNPNLGIKGKKQDSIFSIYKGVWFCPKYKQYFVGKKLSYKESQEKGFGMRRVIGYHGSFDPNSFFPLLCVDFVRYKEFTVYPYPFHILRISREIIGK